MVGCTLGLLLNHDMVEAQPDWRAADAPQIPPNSATGARVITADNVDQFRHESEGATFRRITFAGTRVGSPTRQNQKRPKSLNSAGIGGTVVFVLFLPLVLPIDGESFAAVCLLSDDLSSIMTMR